MKFDLDHLSDKQIAKELLKRNHYITYWFFNVKYKGLFITIIHQYCKFKVDYDEFVTAFYLYLLEVPKSKKSEDNVEEAEVQEKVAPLETYSGEGSLYSWMNMTARHFILRYYEKIFVEDRSKEEETLTYEPEPEQNTDKVSAKMDLETLLKALAKLNPTYAMVVRMLCLEEMTPSEVADKLNIKIPNVYNIKSRGISELKNLGRKRGF